MWLVPAFVFAAFVAGVAFERNKHATPKGQEPAKASVIVKPDTTTTVPIGALVAFDVSAIPMIMGRMIDPIAKSDQWAILEPVPAVNYVFKAVGKGMAKITVNTSDGVTFSAYITVV